MPVDSEDTTVGSPAGPEEAQAPSGAETDNAEQVDVCDEAEAAEEADLGEATEEADLAEATEEADLAEAAEAPGSGFGRFSWKRILAYGVLPGLALILALGAGYLKWQDTSARDARPAATQSVRTATESTIAMLSYHPDTVEKDLTAARDRLTGQFKDAYTTLTNDVVIPGAKQKQISAVATVPAAASVSATENHAVVVVFVNQTIIMGNDPPTDTASTVRVTLDKVHGRWLISQFDPV
jgi:Mce-associated membrane protein